MSEYYDRQGNALTLSEWASRSGSLEEKIVRQETVGDQWVSTVWLGLNHQYGDGPPLIFETMVFPADRGSAGAWIGTYADRYSTEAQAIAGHERIVAAIKDGTLGKNEAVDA